MTSLAVRLLLTSRATQKVPSYLIWLNLADQVIRQAFEAYLSYFLDKT